MSDRSFVCYGSRIYYESPTGNSIQNQATLNTTLEERLAPRPFGADTSILQNTENSAGRRPWYKIGHFNDKSVKS